MKNAGIALIAFLAALCLAEIALRLLNLYSPPPWPLPKRAPGYYHADPSTGYRLWPSSRTCERYPEEGGPILEVVSNSDGFRSSRELGAPDPRPRILVLGDSFVFGLGVEDGERFTELVEEIEPRWRVDNLGMTGFGVDLMVRALEALGRKAAPDVVVLAVYTQDYERLSPQYAGMGYISRKFRLEGKELREMPFAAPTGLRRMRLWQTLLDLEHRMDPSYMPLNEALFDRFRTLTLALGAQPVALFLPGRADTPRDRARREHLRAWSERVRAPFRDLTDPLTEAGIKNTYIPGNYHWNVRGHRVAAEALHALLLEVAALVQATAPGHAGTHRATPWRDRGTSFCRDLVLEGPDTPALPNR